MKTTLAIALREFGARRELLLVALAAAALSFMMPLLPGLGSYSATELWFAGSVSLAIIVGALFSIGLGTVLFGRDLSEGRLGFLFDRPVSGISVWFGKLAGAIALVLICEFLVLVPALFSGDPIVRSYFLLPPLNLAFIFGIPLLGMSLLLLLLSHVLSVMVRARSAWLILDLIGIVVSVTAMWLALWPLIEADAEIAALVVGGIFGVGLLLSLIVAGAAGVMIGRTDLRRTHGAVSLTMWGSFAIVMAIGFPYGVWLGNFGPEAVEYRYRHWVVPGAGWVEIIGDSSRHFDVRRRFLVSTTDDRWLALPFLGYQHRSTFSSGGNRAAWLGYGRNNAPRTLWYANLDEEQPIAKATTLVVPLEVSFWLSPEGRRLALLEDQHLSVYDLDSERLTSVISVPEDLTPSVLFFLDRETIRLYSWTDKSESTSIRIAEIDVSSGEMVETGTIHRPCGWEWWSFDDRRKFVLIRFGDWCEEDSPRIVFDAKSGRLVRATEGVSFFLHDSRLVFAQNDKEQKVISVESPGGGDRVDYDLSGVEAFYVFGEPVPGEMMIETVSQGGNGERESNLIILDLETGTRRSLAKGSGKNSSQGDGSEWSWEETDWWRFGPSRYGLFGKFKEALVHWDPETGVFRIVAGGVE